MADDEEAHAPNDGVSPTPAPPAPHPHRTVHTPENLPPISPSLLRDALGLDAPLEQDEERVARIMRAVLASSVGAPEGCSAR
jgi:hypothetical protein